MDEIQRGFGIIHNSWEIIPIGAVPDLSSMEWLCEQLNDQAGEVWEEPFHVFEVTVPPELLKKKCDLCGHLETGLQPYLGRNLCEQCLMGEVENPEHALPEVA